MQTKQIEDIVRRVSAALPEGLDALGEDLRANLHAALAGTLQRMDLVSREEFDVQSAVLARTRARLESLEEVVSALEASAGISTDAGRTARRPGGDAEPA